MLTSQPPRPVLVATLLLVLGLLASARPAVAAPPTFDVIVLDRFGPAPFLTPECGFPVLSGVEGVIKVSTREGKDGVVYEIARIRLTRTFVNAETGETITTQDVGVDRVIIQPDGSATVLVAGLIFRFVQPGEGLVGAETGRLVLVFDGPDDEEPEVLFEAGQKDDFVAALCAALAP